MFGEFEFEDYDDHAFDDEDYLYEPDQWSWDPD